MIKSLLVFNKVTDYIEKAPEHTDISTDIVDLINANKNNNNNVGQVPVTNQNSNTVQVTNALNQALGMNNNNNINAGTMMPPIMQPPTQVMQPVQPPHPNEFSYF